MLRLPRFKNHLDVAVVDRDKLFIGREDAHFLIEGSAINAVARVIDGSTELDEIIAHRSKLDSTDKISSLVEPPGLGIPSTRVMTKVILGEGHRNGSH